MTKAKKKSRKFWKTVITVTVLSEDYPISAESSLSEIDRAMTYEDLVGEVEIFSADRLNRKEVVKELIKMSSSPEFFDLDEKGRDTF